MIFVWISWDNFDAEPMLALKKPTVTHTRLNLLNVQSVLSTGEGGGNDGKRCNVWVSPELCEHHFVCSVCSPFHAIGYCPAAILIRLRQVLMKCVSFGHSSGEKKWVNRLQSVSSQLWTVIILPPPIVLCGSLLPLIPCVDTMFIVSTRIGLLEIGMKI